MMDFRLYQNGTFDLYGNYYTLAGCSPSINGRPLSASSVTQSGNGLRWDFSLAGDPVSLTLTFRMEGDLVEVGTSLSGPGLRYVHDVCLISGQTTGNPERVFVQGKGMEGPSGYYRIGQPESFAAASRAAGSASDSHAYRSSGLIVLTDKEKHALLLFAKDHRRYENRYSLRREETLFEEKETILEGGFCLENTVSERVTLPGIYVREFSAYAAADKAARELSAPSALDGAAIECPSSALDQAKTYAAERIAEEMGARHDKPNAFHWSSWYYLYSFFDEELLEEYLKGFQEQDADFRYVQIDDGYTDHQGDWLKPGKFFPGGLKAAAEKIKKAGFLPGIWVAPFMVGNETDLYHQHPDWMLKNRDGSVYLQMASYNEPKAFGSRDTEYYVLDTSNPEALAYLTHVFRTLYEWGFRLFKTDFLFWNMHDSSKVRRFDSSLTSIEIYRKTMQAIRDAIGEDSYLLGCISPFLPAVGIVDGMRIAGDVGAQWEGAYGPQNLIREVAADSYFNNIYWQNDPDAVMLRSFDLHLSEIERQSVMLLQALSGGCVTTSDPLHKLKPESLELLKFIHPDVEKHRPSFPRPEIERPDLIMTAEGKDRRLFYALNKTDRDLTVSYDLSDYQSDGFTCWRRYRNNENGTRPVYTTSLKPHESLLLFLTREPLAQDSENLWT